MSNPKTTSRGQLRRFLRLFVIFAALLGLSWVIPIPYYAMGPGDAVDIRPLVQVEGKNPQHKGHFLLTTISLGEATVFDFLHSVVSHNIDLLPKDQVLMDNESPEEYERRQMEEMETSQKNAMVSAFREASYPVEVQVEGIEVFNDTSVLKHGDLIKKVDGKKFQNPEQLSQYLSVKKPGDEVDIEFFRDKKMYSKKIKLVSFATREHKQRVGLGIVSIARVKVKTTPKAKIEAGKIGGPSAGLMFSLEILNRLLPEDLSHGHKIAGTGTISNDGKVGQIGGIEYKVGSAALSKASIFFCPRDIELKDTNEKEAKETAKRLGTSMKIVPVSSLHEAVQYLKKMK